MPEAMQGGAVGRALVVGGGSRSRPKRRLPPSAAVTLRLLRLALYLLREPAEFIGNVWCLQGQIAQTVGRIAEERR